MKDKKLMNSFGKRLSIVIVLAVILPSIAIGTAGVFNLWRVIDSYSDKDLQTSLDAASEELDGEFNEVQQSVNIMKSIAEYQMEDVMEFAKYQKAYQDYNTKVQELFEQVATNVDGMDTYYFRYDPSLMKDAEAGFYCIRNQAGDFEYVHVTPIVKKGDETDKNLSWYFEAVDAKQAIWVTPYYNMQEGTYLTSYSIPIYKDGFLIGVLGADMSLTRLQEIAEKTETLCGGNVFIMDEHNSVLYHKDYTPGEEIELDKANHKLVKRTLKNGMIIAIEIDDYAVYKDAARLANGLMIAFLVILVVFLVIANIVSMRAVRPINELILASQQIAGGNYDVDINARRRDEIGDLSRAIENMATMLKGQDLIMKSLAYNDSLTGLQNNTSYRIFCNVINEEIKTNPEQVRFCVVVFDLNGLKRINDELGHDAGNKLIITAAEFLTKIFGSEHLYRVGGDEFVLILKDDKAPLYELERASFNRSMGKQSFEYSGHTVTLSIACGSANFQLNRDSQYADVFERADKHMYENKMRIKTKLGMEMR